MKTLENIEVTVELAKKEEGHTLCFKNDASKQYVLSRYTPKADAISQIPEDKGNKQTIWIILGFALGYIVKELLSTISEHLNIIVIEPNEAMLEQQMVYENNVELKRKKNIHFLYCEDSKNIIAKLNELIPTSEIYNVNIISMKSYLTYYLKYYKVINQNIKDALNNKILDINTVKKLNILFTQNIIKNRRAIEASYQLEILKDKCKNIPAVVVSAGPSLSKNIEYIKDFKGLVLVGNRTLAPVMQQGVRPNFMFAVDGEDITLDTTMGTVKENIPLVATADCNSKLVAAHNGRKYFINGGSNARALLGVELAGGIPMSGSVATLCTSIAHYMGCNPIIFIGQDCAYTDMKIYAESCANTQFTDEMSNDSDFIQFNKVLIDEYYGGEVWSSVDLILFKNWFEKFIEATPETTYINATEGGANIKGAINKPFKEVTKEYQAPNIPDLSRYDKKVITKGNVDEHLGNLYGMLKEIIKQAENGISISERLEKEYKLYDGKRMDQIRQCIKALNNVDEILKANNEINQVTAMIFSSLQYDHQHNLDAKGKIKETYVEEGIRISKDSNSLYTNIKEASESLMKLVNENR